MIRGFEIGHHTADGDGWLTGTTVVLARSGAVGGVDVRGGGPGTPETDLLDPSTLVPQVHAVVLTGGSAYGLADADGVTTGLETARIGFPLGAEPGQVVPIVPAAVIFDLGRGGEFGHRPDAAFGREALAAATAEDPTRGTVGAGTAEVFTAACLDTMLGATGRGLGRRTPRSHPRPSLTSPAPTSRHRPPRHRPRGHPPALRLSRTSVTNPFTG